MSFYKMCRKQLSPKSISIAEREKRVEKTVVGERKKSKGNRVEPFIVEERHKL